MRNFLSNILRKNARPETYIIKAIKATDRELEVIIANTARVYGSDSPQVGRLKGIITARNRHFQPFH